MFSRLFYGRRLQDVLNEQRIVKVHGIRFTIKKVDPLVFLDGSKVMLQEFDTYKVKKDLAATAESALKQVKVHYTDVFCSSVISPKLVRKREDAFDENGMALPDVIFVEYLFTEWNLAHELYSRIIEFTYGKKKFKLNT